MKKLFFVLFLALGVSYWGWGQQLGIFEFTGTSTGDNQFNAVTSQPSNGTFSTFTRVGVSWNGAANVFNSSGWNVV